MIKVQQRPRKSVVYSQEAREFLLSSLSCYSYQSFRKNNKSITTKCVPLSFGLWELITRREAPLCVCESTKLATKREKCKCISA